MAHASPAPSNPAALQPARKSIAPIVIALVIGAIGFFVITSSTTGGSGMFSYTMAELSERKAELDGKDVKVAGRIVKGSVRGEPASPSFRFDLEDDAGNSIAVGYTRLLPDPFEEGRDAIVQGRVENGVIQASMLTVKCPSRYADTESMTDADKQRYYETDYRKHAEMGAGKGNEVAPAAAAPAAAPSQP